MDLPTLKQKKGGDMITIYKIINKLEAIDNGELCTAQGNRRLQMTKRTFNESKEKMSKENKETAFYRGVSKPGII